MPHEPEHPSFAEARARAAALGHAIDDAAIRDSPDHWFFPFRGIGSLGALVEKRGGRVVQFGSLGGVETWFWAYERGLLDDPPGDLVIAAFRDLTSALDFLRLLRVGRNQAERRALLSSLPLTLPGAAHWQSIPGLLRHGEALEWRVLRARPR